jgi:hypothetical protein
MRAQLADDVSERDPRGFLNWAPIRKTMFIGALTTYSLAELRALKADARWASHYSPALTEDAPGCPTPTPVLPRSSGNLVHHAYHALMFEGPPARLRRPLPPARRPRAVGAAALLPGLGRGRPGRSALHERHDLRARRR